MTGYYETTLSAERLKLCYELAPPAVQRYLAAEIDHVRARLIPGGRTLELGCGYGRVLRELAPAGGRLTGIDTSEESLRHARHYLQGLAGIDLCRMDAAHTGFAAGSFDLVVCIQNGISAFHVDPHRLCRQAVRLTRRGGRVLFSSYAPQFWDARLAWFRLQAEHGLVGPIDDAATGDGRIVCRDGFTATTVSPGEFVTWTTGLGVRRTIELIADASLFCEIVV
ncbi:MAG: class I SAM-dependent methyltransferase [Acidobacteria bacterium]|nr:class I SAM-dependent methyltransferase [Acidobacteriota bacterium]